VYQWLLFLHVAAVLSFVLAHGVQVSIMIRQRSEPDPERNLALFEVLPTVVPLRILAAAIVISGVLLVAALSIWTRLWIWLSLGLLIAIWIVMARLGGGYYNQLEEAATRAIEARGTAGESEAHEAFARARRSPHPLWLAITGLGGLAVITWLMVFRPF
jgi:hypothetical protein